MATKIKDALRIVVKGVRVCRDSADADDACDWIRLDQRQPAESKQELMVDGLMQGRG